jgi:hypothetical protein
LNIPSALLPSPIFGFRPGANFHEACLAQARAGQGDGVEPISDSGPGEDRQAVVFRAYRATDRPLKKLYLTKKFTCLSFGNPIKESFTKIAKINHRK